MYFVTISLEDDAIGIILSISPLLVIVVVAVVVVVVVVVVVGKTRILRNGVVLKFTSFQF